MPRYLTPSGVSCSAQQAYDGAALRPGYKEIIEDGEYVSFSLAFRDSAPAGSIYLTDAPAGSLDAKIKEAIEREAKAAGVKPSEWLASKDQRGLEQFIGKIASQHVASFTGQGIANAFSLDAAALKERQRENARALRDAALAARNSPAASAELARLTDQARSDFNDAHAKLSDERRNAWRNGAEIRDAARIARYR